MSEHHYAYQRGDNPHEVETRLETVAELVRELLRITSTEIVPGPVLDSLVLKDIKTGKRVPFYE